jgi:thiaminase/transcriptional activator TenA
VNGQSDSRPQGLFDRLKADNPDSWAAYTGHQFVRRLADGSLPEVAFRRYLTQDYLFLIQFARAYALAAYKSETLADIRQASASLANIAEREMTLHVSFCKGWGLSEAEMEATPEARETMAYTRFVLERGMAGDLLDLHVALAPCLIGYAEIAKAIGPVASDNPYRAWVEAYASEEYQEVATREVAVLESLMERRGGPGRFTSLSATFGAASRLEADFWQMGLDAAD